MSSLYRVTGIILNRRNIGNVDRRVTIFAADGKRELRARGTQKLESKLAGSLEPLTLVELTVARGRSIDHVIGSAIRDSYRAIHENLARIAGAAVLASAADLVIHGVLDDPRPYKVIREAFVLLTRSVTNRDVLTAVAYGLWNLAKASGYHPSIREFPHMPAAKRLSELLLQTDVNMTRRIRSSVATARACAEAALVFVERTADREIPAAAFFQRILFGTVDAHRG